MIFKEKWQKIIIVGFFLVVYGSKKTPWSLIMPFFVEKECISNAPQGLLVWGVTRCDFLLLANSLEISDNV